MSDFNIFTNHLITLYIIFDVTPKYYVHSIHREVHNVWSINIKTPSCV